MSQTNKDLKSDLIYKELSSIDNNLFSQINLFFISTKFDASEVILVTDSGDVYGFGTNINGRLGLGHNGPVSEPTIISELCGKGFIKIEFTSEVMVVLTESMSVYISGYFVHPYKSSGRFIREPNFLKPFKIESFNQLIVDVKCGSSIVYLLTDTKEVYWFSYNEYKNSSICPTLLRFDGSLSQSVPKQIKAIASGLEHTLALTESGEVYSWQIKHKSLSQLINPKMISISNEVLVKSISCGDYHSLLLTTDGHIYSFYAVEVAPKQPVMTSFQIQRTPKLIHPNYKFTEILAFNHISMAINDTNEVLIWDVMEAINSLTNTDSFQVAINSLDCKTYMYEPLSVRQALVEKEDNQVMKVNRILTTIANAFNDPKYSDLKFKLKHKGSEDIFDYIYVHKWFIAKQSQYFDRMIVKNLSESKFNEIEITGYSFEAYYQYIHCLYTDSIKAKDTELLIELLSLTDAYSDEETKKKCVQSIKPLMTYQNVCSLYSTALRHKSKELEEFCFNFMSKNLKRITESEDFDQMDSNYAKDFLKKYSKYKYL